MEKTSSVSITFANNWNAEQMRPAPLTPDQEWRRLELREYLPRLPRKSDGTVNWLHAVSGLAGSAAVLTSCGTALQLPENQQGASVTTTYSTAETQAEPIPTIPPTVEAQENQGKILFTDLFAISPSQLEINTSNTFGPYTTTIETNAPYPGKTPAITIPKDGCIISEVNPQHPEDSSLSITIECEDEKRGIISIEIDNLRPGSIPAHLIPDQNNNTPTRLPKGTIIGAIGTEENQKLIKEDNPKRLVARIKGWDTPNNNKGRTDANRIPAYQVISGIPESERISPSPSRIPTTETLPLAQPTQETAPQPDTSPEQPNPAPQPTTEIQKENRNPNKPFHFPIADLPQGEEIIAASLVKEDPNKGLLLTVNRKDPSPVVISANMDGIIRLVENSKDPNGNTIAIVNQKYIIFLGCLSNQFFVQDGARVTFGQKLGTMGTSCSSENETIKEAKKGNTGNLLIYRVFELPDSSPLPTGANALEQYSIDPLQFADQSLKKPDESQSTLQQKDWIAEGKKALNNGIKLLSEIAKSFQNQSKQP